MEEMEVGTMLLEQVVPQLVTALGLGLGVLVVWLRSKTAKAIRDNIQNEGIQKAILWVNGLVADMVGEASQTIVKQLKVKLDDGKITKEERREALEELKNVMLAKLSDLTIGRLVDSGAVANRPEALALLESKIEAAVPVTKATHVAGNGLALVEGAPLKP